MGQRVRFDWRAAAAVARVAEAAYGPARGAQRRQSYAYLDDSGADYGPTERAVFGKDSHLQKRGRGIYFCRADFFRDIDFRSDCFRRDQ